MSSVIATIGIVAVLCGARGSISCTKKGIDPGFDQLHRDFHKLIVAHSIAAPVNAEVLAFDEAKPPQLIEKRDIMRRLRP
jgi:hypothetical protein